MAPRPRSGRDRRQVVGPIPPSASRRPRRERQQRANRSGRRLLLASTRLARTGLPFPKVSSDRQTSTAGVSIGCTGCGVRRRPRLPRRGRGGPDTSFAWLTRQLVRVRVLPPHEGDGASTTGGLLYWSNTTVHPILQPRLSPGYLAASLAYVLAHISVLATSSHSGTCPRAVRRAEAHPSREDECIAGRMSP